MAKFLLVDQSWEERIRQQKFLYTSHKWGISQHRNTQTEISVHITQEFEKSPQWIYPTSVKIFHVNQGSHFTQEFLLADHFREVVCWIMLLDNVVELG